MAKKVYEEENIRAIAEKIREKTGSETTYKTSDMPKGIDDVYEQAYGTGYGDGIVDGSESGYNEGFEAGQKAEYDKFWDAHQKKGNRTSCEGMFMGEGWNEETLKPKYNISPATAYMMFAYCGYTGDLDDVFKNRNINLGFSKSVNMAYAFLQSNISVLGEIDCSQCKTTDSTDSIFNTPYIVTIKNLIPPAIAMKKTCWGNGLVNLNVGGEIVENFDISRSTKLTHESLLSIINALKNFVEKETLRYVSGSYGSYSVSGYSYDPKGITWNVTEAALDGTTLTCKCNDGDNTDVTFTVTNIEIAEEDVAKIKTIQADVMDFNEETYEFITDVVITMEEVTGSKTLTLGETNLAKLTDDEKKIATDKGWTLA